MKVRLIKKQAERWAGVKFYRNCYHAIGSYYTRSGRRYTGLEREDAERLGKELGFDLRPESDFWDSFHIKLTSERDEIIIDTENNPYGELQYKFLKGHKRVAQSIKDITPGKDYILIHEDLEAQVANTKARIKRKAFSEFDTMTPEQMRKALRMYGINASNSNNDIVENTLFALVEEDPFKFLNVWVENVDRETQYLIEEALSKNILRKNKTTYYYGTDTIGHVIEEAIAYLKDPKNNDVRLAILSQLEGRKALVGGESGSELKSEAEKILEQIEKEKEEIKAKEEEPKKKKPKKSED